MGGWGKVAVREGSELENVWRNGVCGGMRALGSASQALTF